MRRYSIPLPRRLASLALCVVLMLGMMVIPASAKGPNYLTAATKLDKTKNVYYMVELVAGSDGYPNREGSVTIQYTDAMFRNMSTTLDFSDAYDKLHPGNDLKDKQKKFDYSLSIPWLSTPVPDMQGLGNGYVGNYYRYDTISDTCLLPHTATDFGWYMSVNDRITDVKSITVTLEDDDSLILQSVRLIELDSMESYDYWNGSYALERTRGFTGTVVAASRGSSYTVNGKSSITFTAGQRYDYMALDTYPNRSGAHVDNRGSAAGVSIQIADVLGAGIESYLAWNGDEYGKTQFQANSALEKQAGAEAKNAWYNLHPWYREPVTLSIQYVDVFGSTRQVDIPFCTTYMIYILKENRGKLGSSTYSWSWIAGIFQQNENVALPVRLAEYSSLAGIRFTYGSAPYGFDLDSANKDRVDTANDTISIENICFYEGVTTSNFTSKYDTKKLACEFRTSLTPAYSYSSATEQGQQLASGASLNLSVSGGSLTPGTPRARNYANKYLIQIQTSTMDLAGTTDPVSISLEYTDSSGVPHTTSTYSIPDLTAAYYGYSSRIAGTNNVAPSSNQYEQHMNPNTAFFNTAFASEAATCEFVLEIPDLGTVQSVTLILESGGGMELDEWQMSAIRVYRLSGLEQRTGRRAGRIDTVNGIKTIPIIWERAKSATEIAYSKQSVLFSTNNPSRTIYFTTYDEEGMPLEPEQPVKTDDYLISMPETMTYSEAKKDLGLSIVKYTYQVDVQVADIEDAGSTNYFYFQLAFENGASGVVLANQQLASDSFRQGMTESFQIKTTQNYGNIVSVRIICDNTSSDSNVFDKLNIEKLTVTMRSDSGISKSWVVDQVGWINITYVDEGAEGGVAGLDALLGTTSSSANIVKEFAVTGQATAVDLLFCVSTASSSARDSVNPLENALGGKFEATLIYRDSSGKEQTMNFDLPSKIKAYNDTENTSWIFRPNHVDRFTLSIPDVSSVIAMAITRTDGKGTWVISNVSIQQIGGLGTVYLSPTLSEYYRDPTDAADLAVSTNDRGITYSISGTGDVRITFTENSIDIASMEELDGWSASISRVPAAAAESLNIYLLPGSVIGQNYSFTSSSPAVRATVKYTTVYGGALIQNAFTLNSLGELNGQTVLYGKNLSVNAMSSLNSMVLSSTSASGNQPYISAAIVERSRGGVLVGTYYIDFGNAYLGNGTPPEHSPSTTYSPADMHQILRLQPAAGQSEALTAETNDVAVALRYTSTLDPAGDKTVYQSPYVYFTDVGCTAITTGHFLDIPFALSNVDEITGLSIVTTGPVATFDNAIAYSYAGPAPLPGGTEDAANLLDVCSLSMPLTASTLAAAYTENGQLVTPAAFRFTTASEAAAAGAGTSGMVSMTVCYVDSTGAQRSMDFENLLSYLPSDSGVVPGSTVEIPVQLSDAAYLDHIVLSADDSWLIASVSAELTPPGGASSVSSASVNNWARSALPLTIDLLPAAYGGTSEGNQIQTFTVTGRGQNAQITASATAASGTGGSLLVTAYEGDTVELTPAVTAAGGPDTTWSWNAGSYESYLTVRGDNSASFRVPGTMSPGSSCTFSVACNGDRRLTVSITIAVEEDPDRGLRGGEGEIDSGSAE